MVLGMPGTTADRSARVRREAVAVFAVMGLIAAVVSYRHALQVVRDGGTGGGWAYLPPLLPDGLIYISAVALYEAAHCGARRPRWAVAGLILGCLVTLVMNVASGWPDRNGSAWISALAPVVLFFALEILTGVLRRGQRGHEGQQPAGTGDRLPAMSLDEAMRAAAPFMSQRELAAAFRVGKTTAARKGRPMDAPAAAAASPAPGAAAGALNGKAARGGD
jgi:hypothetical protein